MTTHCPSCGGPRRPHDTACFYCGTPRPQAKPKPVERRVVRGNMAVYGRLEGVELRGDMNTVADAMDCLFVARQPHPADGYVPKPGDWRTGPHGSRFTVVRVWRTPTDADWQVDYRSSGDTTGTIPLAVWATALPGPAQGPPENQRSRRRAQDPLPGRCSPRSCADPRGYASRPPLRRRARRSHCGRGSGQRPAGGRHPSLVGGP